MHDGNYFPLGSETPFLDSLAINHRYVRKATIARATNRGKSSFSTQRSRPRAENLSTQITSGQGRISMFTYSYDEESASRSAKRLIKSVEQAMVGEPID